MPAADQLVLDPALAELLGLGRQCRGPGGAEFGACRLAELGEPLGLPAQRLGVALEPSGSRDLVAPTETHVERAFADELLRGVAAPVAGDVAGADRDEVGRDAEFVAEGGDSCRAEQVDLDRSIER